jgi:putative protease
MGKKPEILAPVGTWEMCLAAVHNGADAIYLGMPGFNARGRAKTFSIEEVRQIIDYCHLYGVRTLLAFNILVFEKELKDAAEILKEILPLRPDALIVQDIGLVRLVKELAPDQVVHASTQMTISNNESIELVSELGIKRYVLARELSIPEIKRIRENTEAELEVFVHGALCVAYSGQCLTSESQGGRSANRGQCAQACRLPYDLIVDGQKKDLGAKQYLVSPKDLCGLSEVPELQNIPIDSFKIEGRLKTPEYVASTVRNYRNKLDGKHISHNAPVHEMKVTYSRDYFSGWLHGVDHQRLVDGRYSSHRGINIGKISRVSASSIVVDANFPLQAGDGLLCSNFETKNEIGAKVFSTRRIQESEFELRFMPGFDLTRFSTGMEVFVNSSDAIEKDLRKSFNDREQLKRVPISLQVEALIGAPLKVLVRDELGNQVVSQTESILSPARAAPITTDFLRDELSALGTTPFRAACCEINLPQPAFIHHKEIKNLRRNFVALLSEARIKRDAIKINSLETTFDKLKGTRIRKSTTDSCELAVLIRDKSQIAGLKNENIHTVYLDYEFGKEYAESVQDLREKGFKVGIATTRILKPAELAHLKVIERLRPDVVLVRNLGALQFFKNKGLKLVGDFSLNAANSLTARWLTDKGLDRICPSYDLNREQLLDLCQSAPDVDLEITIHQYMPTFHMEHCVFAAFLSKGSSYRDCGRPCEKHRVEMRDPQGVLHPIKPDAECRNTVFQGKPQSAARLVPELVGLGVKHFRLEALFEDASELERKVRTYSELLQAKCSPSELFDSLGVVERYGVTEGQLYNIRSWQDRKKPS